MFRKLLLTAGLGLSLAYAMLPTKQVEAQNITCSDKNASDRSNACANTRFVQSAGSNIATDPTFWLNCLTFTPTTKGCVPAGGADPTKFLRADGTWASVPGSVPIGGILPWMGATVPTGFVLAFGQAVSRTTFSALLAAITFTPTINCTSGSPTIAVSIATSDRMPIGAKIEAPGCFSGAPTVVSKGSGSLTYSSNAIATTSVVAVLFPWGNGDGSTTFNVPNLMGRTLVGRDNMSGSAAGVLTAVNFGSNPDALGAIGGSETRTLVAGNLPPYTPAGTLSGGVTITDPGHSHTVSQNSFWTVSACPGCGIGGGGDFGAAGTTSIGVNSNTTGITASLSGGGFTGTAQGGTSTPFGVIQPAITVDFIIRILPDATTAASNLVLGVSTITGGSNNTILYDNGGFVGELALSTANQYNCATAGTIVQPSVVYQAETTTTYGTTTTFDFCTFKNTKVTLTGNITTQTLSNVVAGKAGMISFIQDGTGSRTTVWNSVFKFTGGTTPVLTTTAGAVDILTYACRSATFCGASLLTDVK